MGFLDRFHSQPDWKHTDPAVRVMAVEELPDEDQKLLGSIAREDADAGVRRVAVGRLGQVETLLTVARDDEDEGVRAGAIVGLRHLALEGTDEAVAEAALAGLEQPRDRAEVATGAALERVAMAALLKLTDVKAIGMVARRAGHASVRLEALVRVFDQAVLANVALKSDHKDVALAALDRLLPSAWAADRETLKAIAARARNKAAARRAKAVLRMLDGEPARPSLEALRERRLHLCLTVESVTGYEVSDRAASELAGARQRWADLQALSDRPEDADLARRFVAACEALQDSLARHADARAEVERRVQERAKAVAARVALCEAVDKIDGDGAVQLLDEARSAWTGLAPLDPTAAESERLRRRFELTCRDCERRYEHWKAAHARQRRLEELVRDAEQLVESTDLAGTRARWAPLQQEWAQLTTRQMNEVLQSRFQQAESRLLAREAAEREQQRRQRRENLSRLQQRCQEIESAAQTEGLALKDVERGIRSARAALADLGFLPSRRDRDELSRRLKTVQVALRHRLQEIEVIDDWHRWAKMGVQEQLCRRLEALRPVADDAEVARQVRDIMARWKQASVPEDQSEALWRRFKAAHDEIRPRCEAYFAQQANERADRLRRKMALCEEAEALATSTEWIKTAERLTRLQAVWKSIEPAPRRHENALWTRFRTACNQFFTRRKTDLARRREEWAKHLERKEQLCMQAAALVESTDWETAAAAVRRLQAEWKTVGPVRKNRSEAIWERFRTACNRFLERYEQRDQIAFAANLAEHEALCRELEEMPRSGEEAAASPAPERLEQTVQGVRRRWQQAAELPRTHYYALSSRFTNAVTRLLEIYPESFRGTDLDPERNLRTLEQLCARVEGFLAKESGKDEAAVSMAEVLASTWREALAANTMGVRVDEEARWREAMDQVKRAQAEHLRLGPLPGEKGKTLSERFRRVCDRFFEQRPGRVSAGRDRRAG